MTPELRNSIQQERTTTGVPDENWLPINRGDEGLDIILRVYVPDLAKMKTTKAPKAVLVK